MLVPQDLLKWDTAYLIEKSVIVFFLELGEHGIGVCVTGAGFLGDVASCSAVEDGVPDEACATEGAR